VQPVSPRPQPLYAVDMGLSRWKAAFVQISPARVSLGTVEIRPSFLPFFSTPNGFANCMSSLFAQRPNWPAELDGLGLAVPFRVEVTTGAVASDGRGGWPHTVPTIDAALTAAVGTTNHVVLNDAIAYSLGAGQRLSGTPSAGGQLFVTLGTNLGVGWRPDGHSVLRPVEINSLLAGQPWPESPPQPPSLMLSTLAWLGHDLASWTADHWEAYGRRVGWAVGALTAHTPTTQVIFGGGRANGLPLAAVKDGIAELSRAAPDLTAIVGDAIALEGLAFAWHSLFREDRPLSDLVGAGLPSVE
jgi:hypothetical protein